MDVDLRRRLSNVYWVGGAPGAGKSTIARRLADTYDLHLYATDDVMRDHAARTTADESPHLHRFVAMTMDDRWMTRSPRTMVSTFHWFQGEAFHLIVEDLLRLSAESAVVAEGFRLLPRLVGPLLADPTTSVWLLPSPAFRAVALARRGSTWTIPDQTSDPERTRRNLDERDALFTSRLMEETRRLGLPSISLGPEIDEDAVLMQVARQFGLS
ncbi:MAG: AAA family ATPase [Dermatophilaceae bacterium]